MCCFHPFLSMGSRWVRSGKSDIPVFLERRKGRIELFSPGKRSCCCFGALKELPPLPSFGASAREELGASLGTPGSPVQRGEHSSTLIA